MLIGRRSLKESGVGIFGIGTTVSVFHMSGHERLRKELLTISELVLYSVVVLTFFKVPPFSAVWVSDLF